MNIRQLTSAFAVMLLASASALAATGPIPQHQAIPGATPEPIADKAGLRDKADLEAFFDGVMAAHLKYNPMAGATLSVVKDGEVLLLKGYGYADVEKQVPVDAEQSLFRPGSTSKLFTWTAVMQLVEQGKLDLDKDVNEYLTNFKIPDTYPGKPITLRNAMTHTAGLEDGALGYLMAKDAQHLVPLGDALAAHIPARVRPPTTDFANDGTNSSYSNWATAMAGHIVATVSGVPFDDYIKKNIFDPLGMTSSTFAEPLPAELQPRMAVGYQFEAGKLKAHGFEFVHSFGPAGSLTSSAADMAKFMLAHLNGGKLGDAQILKAETAQLMQGRQMSASPYVNGSGLGFYETWINGRRVIGHGGDMIAFHSDLLLLPEEKIGIFVSYNTSNDVAPYVARRDLMQAFMDRYYPAKLPPLKAPEDFGKRAGKYAGTYASNRGSYTRLERVFRLFGSTKVWPTDDNKLVIKDILLPGLTYWVEVAPDTFREEHGQEMIAFVMGPDGNATHLVDPFIFIGSHKLPWYGTPDFHYLVLGLGAFLLVVALVSAVRNWKADRAGPAGPRRARRLAALLAVIYVAFVVALVAGLAPGIDVLIYELPTALYVALAFPLLAIPVTLAVAWLAVKAWRESWFNRYGRIQYTAIAIMSVAFLWSLHYWNLLGYRIG
jgi:CubicO group peptidase (beta-lactamase class C family)